MCHRNPFDLFASGASTAFVRRRLSGIKLYIGTLRKAPSDRLAALARALRRSGVKVAVECGGTLGFAPLDDTSGEESARIELRKIDRFCRAGGRPTRYILQSWYPYPKAVVPETRPYTMTALVKAAILRLHPELARAERDTREARDDGR